MTPAFRVLLLPGWENSGPDHWQSRWEARHGYLRVEQDDWQWPKRGDWMMRLEEELLALAAEGIACEVVPGVTAAIAAAGRGTPAAQDVAEEAGHGIGGLVDGRRVAVGSPRWIDAGPLKARVEDLEAEGQTCVLVTVDGFLAGAIGVRDELRPEVPEVVRTLRAQGVEVHRADLIGQHIGETEANDRLLQVARDFRA